MWDATTAPQDAGRRKQSASDDPSSVGRLTHHQKEEQKNTMPGIDNDENDENDEAES